MWRTSSGERILSGAEGDLFRELVDRMVDEIDIAEVIRRIT